MRIKPLLIKAAIIAPLLLGLSAAPALAGPGHDHSHSHEAIGYIQAETAASKNVARLAGAGKIDESWASIKASKVNQKDFGGGMEWVVTFKNDKIADPDKQTLYVFLRIDGEYLAANYTGE
jgi:hypothetical protein